MLADEPDDLPPLVERDVERVGVEEELAVVLVRLIAHHVHGHAVAQVGAHHDRDAGGVLLRRPGQLPHDLVRGLAAVRAVHDDVGHVPLERAVHELGPCPEPGEALPVLGLVVANVEEVLVEVGLVYDEIVGLPPVGVRHVHQVVGWALGPERERDYGFHAVK